jgi:hypothetical protein
MGVQVIYDTSSLHPGELTGIAVPETQMCGTVNYYHSTLGGKNVPHYRVDLYINNNRTLRVFVKDQDLNIVNLTGATLLLTVRKEAGGTTTFTKSTAIPAQGAIGAADEGECFFYILPADTAALDGQYIFDVKLTTPTGKAYTVLEGILNLLQPGS